MLAEWSAERGTALAETFTSCARVHLASVRLCALALPISYARQLSRVLISCSLPSVGWCGVGLCCTSLADRVAEAQPPRQRTSAGGISPVGAAVLSDTGGTRGGWV